MVRGLALFGRTFQPVKDQYILIGGAAFDLLHQHAGLDFRATKDLDIVLCVDASFEAFAQTLWQFLHQGRYEIRERSAGRPIFYRFREPADVRYPQQIELFSKRLEGIPLPGDARITPIKVGDEIVSLSAILLDDSYFEFLRRGRREILGISTVGPEFLILLKARAFLDLQERRDHGAAVDAKDISKHRNDVIRLFRLVDPNSRIELPSALQRDLDMFITSVQVEDIDPRQWRIADGSWQSILSGIREIYQGGS